MTGNPALAELALTTTTTDQRCTKRGRCSERADWIAATRHAATAACRARSCDCAVGTALALVACCGAARIAASCASAAGGGAGVVVACRHGRVVGRKLVLD